MSRGYGQRIRQVILDLSAKRGKAVTLAEFGSLIGKTEKGRKKPYSASGVSEWLQERAEPALSAFDAMELVSGTPAHWIAFGVEITATPTLPLTPVVTGRTMKKKGRRA